MSHKHVSWRPSPAAKPSHLVADVQERSSQNLAALQGATSAFHSGPKNTSTATQLRQQYEFSHAAKSNLHIRGRSPRGGVDPGESIIYSRSPSRGRRPNPQDAQLAGARSAALIASLPIPIPLDRTSSVVAARLASKYSSPVRECAGTKSSAEVGRVKSTATTDAGKSLFGRNEVRPTFAFSRPSEHKVQTVGTSQNTASLDLGTLPYPYLPPRSASTQAASSTQVGTLVASSVPARTTPDDTVMSAPHNSAPAQLENSAATRHLALPMDLSAMRHKPPVPAPRKGKDTISVPLRPNLTGPRQSQGLTREEAINRMADAIVASSLASTRTPSPTKGHHGQASHKRRSASANNLYTLPLPVEAKSLAHNRPARPMKQTLRKASSEDNEDETEVTKRGRRHLMRKHPNMHHEGDRKRWRDRITEMERRRYEGVFAANRGLLFRPTDPGTSICKLFDTSSEGNQVANVVVRDVWERSRLPAQVLEQIYDLVAPDEPLALHREQFVVGLWLIDQKLKGRKLPIRVSDSVWASVRHSQGIKIASHA